MRFISSPVVSVSLDQVKDHQKNNHHTRFGHWTTFFKNTRIDDESGGVPIAVHPMYPVIINHIRDHSIYLFRNT